MQGLGTAQDWGVIYPDDEYIFGSFVERLWAYLTIRQLLDKRSVFNWMVGFFWGVLKFKDTVQTLPSAFS